ncbi:hypothetical protein FKM82_022790 [Ascaphus truei]
MGLRKVLTIPFWATRTSTLRTFSSSLGIVLIISPMGHSFLATCLSFNKTTSPTWISGFTVCHLWRSWSVTRYSRLQRSQNVLAKYCTCLHCRLCISLEWKPSTGVGTFPTFWVSSIAGVKTLGDSGSVDTGIKGLALTIADISAMNVVSTS